MSAQPSQDLSDLGSEDQQREFKRLVDNPESLAGEIVAFANSEGGTLYLGVDDDGSVVGVDDADAAFQTLGEDDSIVKQQPDITRLHGIFARYADIQAVYLFGSMARGTAHTSSDLDLALLPRGPSLRARKLDLLTDLARHGFCDVDLVFLDTDDIVMRYEAVRLNELVYAAADFDRGALYSSVVRQYLDFLPYLNVQRAAYKRRILGDQG